MTALEQAAPGDALAGRRACIYVRISKDSTEKGEGVDRQLEDCRTEAERRGLTVTAVFNDNDVSAYSGKKRPGFEEMLSRLANGEFDVVIAYHAKRLYRRNKELDRLIDVVGDNPEFGIQIRTVKSGELDLTTAAGRGIARVLAALGQMESEESAERMARHKLRRAEEGARQGPRPFGYEADGVTICEREAAELRRVAAALINGETNLYGACKDLNKRKVFPPPMRRKLPDGTRTEPYSRPWQPATLKQSLLKVRNIGVREYKPVIRGESMAARKRRKPTLYPAQWQPLFDRETHDALVRKLVRGNPNRAGRKGGPMPMHLGTRLYVCGTCGYAAMNYTTGHGDTATYRCTKRNMPGIIGHVSRNAEKFDLFVEFALFEFFDKIGFIDAMCAEVRGDDAETVTLIAERDRIEAYIEELHAQDDDDDPETAKIFASKIKAKTARKREIESQLESMGRHSSLEVLRNNMREFKGPAEEAWRRLNIDQQRAVLAEVFTVRIKPLPGRTSKFRAEADIVPTDQTRIVMYRLAGLSSHSQLSGATEVVK
jgi:site-specific DNA recombinase